MRKLLLFLVTAAAGVVTLAWINFRRENGAGARPEDTGRAEADPEAGAPEPARCAATTAGGKRCTREALEGSQYCWQHG